MTKAENRGAQPRGKAIQRNTAQAEDRDEDIDKVAPDQQTSGRGHRAQLAQPHRAGRPSGGNIRNVLDD